MNSDFLRSTLGNSGIPVFRLGLSASYRPGRQTVHEAFDNGVDLFFCYGFDTQMTGALRELMKGRREKVVVATGAYNLIWGYPNLRRTLEKRLRQLGTDYIDVFLFLGVMKEQQYPPKVREELAALLALMRFVTVSAALDTGSSFEGMGDSRDVQFSALAEPALLVSFAVQARQTSALSMSDMFGQVSAIFWHQAAPSFILVLAAFFIVFLAENARIPFDDPNTHLELTMVHEAMVLEYSGRHLALIEYAAALKLLLYVSLIACLFVPWGISPAKATPAQFALGIAAYIGKLTVGASCSRSSLRTASRSSWNTPSLSGTSGYLCRARPPAAWQRCVGKKAEAASPGARR